MDTSIRNHFESSRIDTMSISETIPSQKRTSHFHACCEKRFETYFLLNLLATFHSRGTVSSLKIHQTSQKKDTTENCLGSASKKKNPTYPEIHLYIWIFKTSNEGFEIRLTQLYIQHKWCERYSNKSKVPNELNYICRVTNYYPILTDSYNHNCI